MKRRALLLALPGLAAAAQAPTQSASLQQSIGATVPLDAPVLDDLGRPARLADYFQPGRPVLLVPRYYRCPQLCGLVTQELLQALHATGLPATDWRVVGLSIDPTDTPADAHRRRALDLGYAQFLRGADEGGALPHLDLLVADLADVRRITAAVGFTFTAQHVEAGPAQYAHPATVVLLTPTGTVARYFNGVGIDASELRVALVTAAAGGVGSWSERLALLCARLDPLRSAHGAAVMNAVRITTLLSIAGLAGVAWRHRKDRP